ncbi:MAG: VanZ family protein, partial [Eubacteriales bacterium]
YVFIFGNSLQPVSESQAESLSVLESVKPVIEVIVGQGNVTDHLIRKIAHFTEFFVLGLEWLVFVSLSKKINVQQIANCLFIGLASAVTDESLQMLSPGRGPQVSDVLLDFSGACFGILVMVTILFLRRQYIKRKKVEDK